MSIQILLGDCRLRMKELADASVDSVVCDPPYHLTGTGNALGLKARIANGLTTGARTAPDRGFMGQKWDGGDIAQDPAMWAEVLRVLKPGGHLVAFSGTRTQHRMVCAIEDAGFEIRDQLAWVYGSGFPKSLDVSKAIAKRAGGAVRAAEAITFMAQRRKELGLSRAQLEKKIFGRSDGNVRNWEDGISLPEAGLWPRIREALELTETPFDCDMERGDVVACVEAGDFGFQTNGERWSSERVVRIPATQAAQQWQGWGTALKPSWEPICLARKPLIGSVAANVLAHGTGAINVDACRIEHTENLAVEREPRAMDDSGAWGFKAVSRGNQGRWPANLCHDGSDEVLAGFPETKSPKPYERGTDGAKMYGGGWDKWTPADNNFGDEGSAARFFYCAKATSEERGDGNLHPTVKPKALMEWLVKLVTPPGGTVLDPFMGSGTTLLAADALQFNAIGCELSPEYAAIAERRIRDAAGMFADVKVAA